MRRWGQAPRGRFGEMPDILDVIRSYQSPAGDATGGNSGDGQGSGGSDGGAAGGGSGETGSDGKPFDAARAQRTIDALREEVKAGKATKTQLDEALARLQAIEDKDKSDGEKATNALKATETKLTAAEQRAADLEAKYTGALIANAIEREAVKGNAVDTEAVAALVDRSAIKVDEGGAVTGADKAVEALLKAKPFLVKAEGGGQRVQDIPGTPRQQGTSKTRDERIAETRKELQASGQYSRW